MSNGSIPQGSCGTSRVKPLSPQPSCPMLSEVPSVVLHSGCSLVSQFGIVCFSPEIGVGGNHRSGTN